MRLVRCLGPAGALLLLGCVSTAAQDPVLTGLDGRPVRVFASATRASVFVFSRTDCPVAARYAPYLERVQRRLADDRVDFALVFVDPAQRSEAIRAYLHDFGYTGPALRDDDHALVRLAGATATPEAAVFVRRGTTHALVYRGRIDDRYMDIGHARPAPTRHDLDDVISAIEAGAPPALRTTPAVGCLIDDVGR